MAAIIKDHLECGNCGSEYFLEQTIHKIKVQAFSSGRNENESIPGRLLDNEQTRYVCAKCGTPLNV